jgi:hypothetical protein
MKMKINLILAFFSLIKTVFSSYVLFPENVTFTQAVEKCNLINATVVLPEQKIILFLNII